MVALPEGELGPNWISAGGGGLGSRGELGAIAMLGDFFLSFSLSFARYLNVRGVEEGQAT